VTTTSDFAGPFALSPRYKWRVLTNTTIGVVPATIDSSIVLIAMPDIFRGVKLDPFHSGLTPAFILVIVVLLIAAAASWSRGARYVHDDSIVSTRPATTLHPTRRRTCH